MFALPATPTSIASALAPIAVYVTARVKVRAAIIDFLINHCTFADVSLLFSQNAAAFIYDDVLAHYQEMLADAHMYRCGWVHIALSVCVARPNSVIRHVVQQKSRPRARAAVSC